MTTSTHTDVPPTEVAPTGKRRTFSAAYKARILAEAAACAPGQLGGLLRREALYSSHVTKWRADHKRGGSSALEPKRPGPRPTAKPAVDAHTRQLERELVGLRRKLARAELLITIQKKAADLLGMELLNEPDENA